VYAPDPPDRRTLATGRLRDGDRLDPSPALTARRDGRSRRGQVSVCDHRGAQFWVGTDCARLQMMWGIFRRLRLRTRRWSRIWFTSSWVTAQRLWPAAQVAIAADWNTCW